MESTLPHALERPLSLAREFDLMHSWNHYIIDSQMLLAPSIWQSYVYAAMWMPFPFPQMECLGTGRGYDLSLVHPLSCPPACPLLQAQFSVGLPVWHGSLQGCVGYDGMLQGQFGVWNSSEESATLPENLVSECNSNIVLALAVRHSIYPS